MTHPPLTDEQVERLNAALSEMPPHARAYCLAQQERAIAEQKAEERADRLDEIALHVLNGIIAADSSRTYEGDAVEAYTYAEAMLAESDRRRAAKP